MPAPPRQHSPGLPRPGVFEAMLENIVDGIQNQNDTALFHAFDEGGGYWDSGLVFQVVAMFAEALAMNDGE
jgi:hypothetical protein